MSRPPELVPGLAVTTTHIVGDADTAQALGSGSLQVLATPRLVAWVEGACCAVVDALIPAGSTTVGTRVRLDHLAASPLGATITARAVVTAVDGRLLQFEVVAVDADERVVAQGEVRRVVVDVDRFLARLPEP